MGLEAWLEAGLTMVSGPQKLRNDGDLLRRR
jgi:hypothetical protein